MPTFDAVLVLGGGVREGGELPSWVQRRLEWAVSIPGEPLIMPLSAGTPHRPLPNTANGFPLFEATTGADFLLQHGIPAERILIEACSWDTIGNAYFSRVVHAEPRQLRRLLVVTSDWHLPRTKLAFDWIYRLTPQALPFELEYRAVPDPDMDQQVVRERTRKEQASADALSGVIARITTLPDFHRWLFAEHNAYRAGGDAFSKHQLSERTLDSY